MSATPEPRSSTDATFGKTPPAVRHGLAPGTVLFGRYRFVRELGRGGMGVVLLADDEVLGIPVAMKIPPQEVMHDTEGLNDLKREVLRGMALTHTGIVRIYSFEHADGIGAIVMEYVQGETMGDQKIHQPGSCFDCSLVVPWLEQLCPLLDYAHHEAKIAHRDLKPRNILVTPAGKIKVTDFGISSILGDSMSRISAQAKQGGTPPYMSPQQAMGEPPTHLDDLYSLGATLYDLITGRPPFFRGNILAQVLEQVPPSMAERRKELGIAGKAAIPSEWEAVVAACLAKDPAARPSSGKVILEWIQGKKPAGRALSAIVPIETPASAVLSAPLVSPRKESNPPQAPAPLHFRRPGKKEPTILAAIIHWTGLAATAIAAGAIMAGVIQSRHAWDSHLRFAQPPAIGELHPTSPPPSTPAHIGENRLGKPQLEMATGLNETPREHKSGRPGPPPPSP